MTYGWADQILQPLMGVNYYESVVAKNGKKTRDFVRLFMVPGMSHCGGGIGPDRNDAVTAVIDWVEKGKAPDQLIASKVTDGRWSAPARCAPIRRSRATRARAASTTRPTSNASRPSSLSIRPHGSRQACRAGVSIQFAATMSPSSPSQRRSGKARFRSAPSCSSSAPTIAIATLATLRCRCDSSLRIIHSVTTTLRVGARACAERVHDPPASGESTTGS